MTETNTYFNPDAAPSRGRWLVLAIFCFALPIGGSGLSMRAWVRGIRGQRTFDSLVANFKRDGYLTDRETGTPPKLGALSLQNADYLKGPSKSAKALEQLLSDAAAYQSASLDHRSECFSVLNAQFDYWSANPAAMRAVGSPAVRQQMALLLEPATLTRAFENEFLSQVRAMDKNEADIRANTHFYSRVFKLAEACDIRACYARVLGSSMESTKQIYTDAVLLAARADKIADQQVIRISDKSLLIFPKVKEFVLAEYSARTKLRLLRSAMDLVALHKTAPKQLKAPLKDPRTGKDIQYQRLNPKEALLSCPSGEKLKVPFH
jgi:hypothetical protein